jgi:2-keto-4-pentenoate hydratase/2-oxohepta-3-ene-1,7-dioic acid hydratase in catechol pathway
MYIANLNDRLVLLRGGLALDVFLASAGRFGPGVLDAYDNWDEFTSWEKSADYSTATPFVTADLGAPIPFPRQILAVGLNYRDHADEASLPIPEHPMVFTKFASSLSGPDTTITVESDAIDYEAEMVLVIAKRADRVAAKDAWNFVAGMTIGQDLTERAVQWQGPVPQFSIGKSLRGFGPFGPAVVSIDAIPEPENLTVRGVVTGPDIEGEFVVQNGNTKDLIFSVPALIERLSADITLFPGDIIFTGTPAGVGMGRDPKLFMRPGHTLTTSLGDIAQIITRFV